jgi:riboflavin kinase/FMN adenylyltransferase
VLEGVVVEGERLGRKFGYPTANLELPYRLMIPKDGIYAVWVEVDGKHHKGACSIGVRPTVGGTKRTVETYLLDFEGDLYGKVISLEFVERLRDEEEFDSLDALVEQIGIDVERTAHILA